MNEGALNRSIIHTTQKEKTQRRIEEISNLFGCEPKNIASTPDEITPDTRVYVGPLIHTDKDGHTIPIFQLLSHVEHVYTQSAESEKPITEIMVGGKTAAQLYDAWLEKVERQYSDPLRRDRDFDPFFTKLKDRIKTILHTDSFGILQKPKALRTIQLTQTDLGFPTTGELMRSNERYTIQHIFDRAKSLGLELCPSELAVDYFLQRPDESSTDGEIVAVAMSPVRNSYINDRSKVIEPFTVTQNIIFTISEGKGFRQTFMSPTPYSEIEDDQERITTLAGLGVDKYLFCLPSIEK